MVLNNRARAILHQLFSWRWSWQARNAEKVFELTAEDSEVFGTVLHYTEPKLMYEIWLYDALVILMLGFLDPTNLRHQPRAPELPTGPLWLPSEALTVEELAVEICRSLVYQLGNLSTPAHAFQWSMPLALAYVTLSPNDPIAQWVYAKVLAAPETRRVPWLCYIDRLQGQDPNASISAFACWPIRRHWT